MFVRGYCQWDGGWLPRDRGVGFPSPSSRFLERRSPASGTANYFCKDEAVASSSCSGLPLSSPPWTAPVSEDEVRRRSSSSLVGRRGIRIGKWHDHYRDLGLRRRWSWVSSCWPRALLVTGVHRGFVCSCQRWSSIRPRRTQLKRLDRPPSTRV